MGKNTNLLNDPVVVAYGVEGYHDERLESDAGEAITNALDSWEIKDWPETITINKYARMVPSPKDLEGSLVESALEWLDDTFGEPDVGYTKPTPAMLVAEKVFVAAILDEYEPWMCEQVGEETINVLEWVKANIPEWLPEGN